MERTSLSLPADLLREAKIRAAAQGITVSHVVRTLLAAWIHGEVTLDSSRSQRAMALERAWKSYGMWKERDPDSFFRESRAGLPHRDQEVRRARLTP